MMNKKAIYHRADDFTLLHGDCIRLMSEFDFKFDMIFADPPYFLSNGGISVQSGKVVCVDKGEWDKGGSPEHIDLFNEEWIAECREHLTENGTIWISGTYHNIFSVANKLTQLGFKILNVITWAKTNPPPNISCRYFTYSTEFIIWARKCPKKPHYFNYDLMKTAEREQTDDGCMEAASHRKMGEIAGQASYAETARPAGTHHPGFNPARSMDPRPVLGKRNYRHRCLADRQALSGHRKGKGISGPEHQEKGGTGEREYRKELPQEDKGYRDCGWRTGRG